ncbi:MAG: hypothetical protein HY823_01680 [Acidobacteria bacterium]|nr:hypothetical protein [Acidobacteriota bacterium]
MSSKRFAPHRALLAGLLLAAGTFAHAQLDPRLRTSKTDFLDLFQQSNSLTTMKPEIMTLFDFTGSMRAIMWHKDYVSADVTDSLYGTDVAMTFTLASKGVVAGAQRFEVTVTCNMSGNGGPNLSAGSLVRPDGSLLNYANNGDLAVRNNYVPLKNWAGTWDSAAPFLAGEYKPGATTTLNPDFAADVRNWIRSASHVRFTSGGKTFDLPICWTVLDSPTVVRNIPAGEYRNMYASNYPLAMTILDPASNTELEIDRSYRVSNVFSSITNTAAAPFNGGASKCNVNVNFAGFRPAYWQWVFTTSTTIPQASGTGKAFASGIPARTRAQAIKDAAMQVWVKYWNKVFWAYRFINDTSGSSGVMEGSTLNSDSTRDMSATDPTTTAETSGGVIGGTQRAWVVLNGNSFAGLKRLASYAPMNGTPLNYAMAHSLAQYNDASSVFNAVETGSDAPIECRKSFLLVFTDGVPNGETGTPTSTTTPYLNSTTFVGDANSGNAAIAANMNSMEPGTVVAGQPSQWFNIVSLAGIAAHGADTSLASTIPVPASYPQGAWPGSTSTVRSYLPFHILQRGSPAVTFKRPHPISTMTVGVSLAGTTTNTAAPKFRLFAAAAVGDPDTKTWDLKTLKPFTLLDPADPSKGKDPTSVNFFDATNPALLTQSLDFAFQMASLSSNVNQTSNPNLPYIGASLGKQVYIGKFKPPLNGGVIWPGDLLMFPTKESGDQTYILDKSGNVASVIDETSAQWSAAESLKTSRLWTARKLYTRLPNTPDPAVSTPTGFGAPLAGLTAFSDQDPAFTLLKPYLGIGGPAPTYPTLALTDDQKKAIIQHVAGADINGPKDTSVPPRPTTIRDNVMGDVINSSPTAIEFTWSDVSTKLTPRLAAVGGNRFRLILVGTNQGWLHAFGEVSKVTKVMDGSGVEQEVVVGAVDELWSFLPTDFLANLQYLGATTNPHRFMVDGTPTIYHLDLPNPLGGGGNGLVDSGERALAVIGLNKGGRSYYALDIHDPFTPALRWAVVPDEAGVRATAVEPGGPPSGTVQSVIASMGFSSCTPALGRVQFDKAMHDAVFFGGGLSLPEIEVNFKDGSGNPIPLGRSVLAMDVWTGRALAAADLRAVSATIGSIPVGLVPFEYFLNSGMAQRAYFMDYKGGLWSWGALGRQGTAPFMDFRVDSSDLALWTTDGNKGSLPGIRHVYQDSSGNGARYTTHPAPFRVGRFPGAGKTGQMPPSAVGVAMVSGDRNNPLDYLYSAGTTPNHHRLTVVFDRQDSYAWGTDTNGILDGSLKNFSNQSNPTNPEITPGATTYYLNPASGNPFLGYYVDFPSISNGFIPKGIVSPMIVAGALFYNYFNPQSADPCAGGNGETRSFILCDVLNPIVNDTRTTVACKSGQVFIWAGVSTGYVALGTRGVIQGGVVPTGAGAPPPGSGTSATTLQLKTFLGPSRERYPKARVWRTVH